MHEAQGLTLVRTNRVVRSAAFAYCLLPLGIQLAERAASWQAWLLLVLQFVAYPQIVYWRALRSAKPARAELDNLFLDSTLLGAWVAYFGFAAWIAFGLAAAAMLNAAVNRGLQGAGISLGASAAGAGLWAAIGEWRFTPETSAAVALLCAVGSLGYISLVGYVAWAQARRLAAARDALRQSEERYRLIAENADDLVAMIDHQGNWLYASPSYRRFLGPEELDHPATAFRYIHPDDAEIARAAIGRAAAVGKPRELMLRLVDREGRVRQLRTRLRPLDDKPPHRVLLVSDDITDLKESEERVLLAGHALEGMTEAIMITAADGTVLTVNRAFCELTGRSREEVLGQPEKAIRSGLLPPEHYDEAYAAIHARGYWSGTSWNRRKNGSIYREWRSIRSVKDPAGGITHYVHVFYEVGGTHAGTASLAGA